MPSSSSSTKVSTPRSTVPLKVQKPAIKHRCSPVIIRIRAPKVVHVSPQNFMKVVQLLTGKTSSSEKASAPALMADNTYSSSSLYSCRTSIAGLRRPLLDINSACEDIEDIDLYVLDIDVENQVAGYP